MSFVCVGKIVKPQGIKGEVKIQPLFEIPAIFNGKHQLFIEKQPASFKSCTYRLGFGYVFFDEIDSRTTAEKYRGKFVYITVDEFDKIRGDFILVDDLVGQTLVDENGGFVGQIVGVENYGFDDIILVNENNHIYEVPFKKAIFDQKGKSVSVKRIEYDGAKVSQD